MSLNGKPSFALMSFQLMSMINMISLSIVREWAVIIFEN